MMMLNEWRKVKNKIWYLQI